MKTFTFTFYVDPLLNEGFSEVFKQGEEPWWWYVDKNEEFLVGPTPNFAGAKFRSMHENEKMVVNNT